jgi:hypothetical protein
LEGLEVLSMERCLKAINTARAPFDRVNLAVRLVDHPSDKTSAGYLNQAKFARLASRLVVALTIAVMVVLTAGTSGAVLY